MSAPRDLTLRDYFAGLAMQAIRITEGAREEGGTRRGVVVLTLAPEAVATRAYEMADAMLKQRRV